MTIPASLIWVMVGLVAIPLATTALNLPFFKRLRSYKPLADSLSSVSVLIPARNEQENIERVVRSVLACRDVELEVIVLDDHSTDRTREIVERIAGEDGRVRVMRGASLPGGWCGKQFACDQLGRAAQYPLLLWVDADVELAPDAVPRLAAQMERTPARLISGFPRQQTGTWMETLLVPLIQVVLLGYLPMGFMKLTRHPGFGAGCGQLMMARRDAWLAIGGHGAVRTSMHDGLTLPRAFRAAGHHTDLFDATDLARCRMYHGAAATWAGLAKNATEGMATPVGLPLWSTLLLGGFALPWLLLVGQSTGVLQAPDALTARVIYITPIALLLHAAAFGPWLQHEWLSILGRPVGVALLVAIQWSALWSKLRGRPSTWKGRAVQTGPLPADGPCAADSPAELK